MIITHIGHALAEGEIDSFQARAWIDLAMEQTGIIGTISDRRFQMFCYRWLVHKGDYNASRDGIWVMVQCERNLWNRQGFNIPAAIIGEGC